MWANNFRKYVYAGVDYKSARSIQDCDKLLQNLFHAIFLRNVNSLQIKEAFSKVKNSALVKLEENKADDIEKILDKSYSLGIRKNHDYGSQNILKYGIIGLIVRLGDKLARVSTLKNIPNTKALVTDEQVEDTLLDIINYATYGEMLADEIWE